MLTYNKSITEIRRVERPPSTMWSQLLAFYMLFLQEKREKGRARVVLYCSYCTVSFFYNMPTLSGIDTTASTPLTLDIFTQWTWNLFFIRVKANCLSRLKNFCRRIKCLLQQRVRAAQLPFTGTVPTRRQFHVHKLQVPGTVPTEQLTWGNKSNLGKSCFKACRQILLIK